jgi:uncharacterized protein (DUF697 family)
MIRQGLRVFGLGRYFWDALREINPNDIRVELELPVTVAFFGRTGTGRHTLARALFGTDEAERPGHGLSFNDVDAAAAVATGSPDLAFLLLDASEPDWSAERQLEARLAGAGYPVFLIVTHADRLSVPSQGLTALRAQFPGHPPELMAVVDPRDDVSTRQQLLGRVLQTASGIRLALGHRYPLIRPVVAEQLIRETSRANAQTALLSSLPTLIPVLGMVVGGMADILILTKNQAMLVFKLAALYGRDLNDRVGILKEISPVVGSAFLWRTAARTAVGLAPAPIAALPKASIAYGGTYLIGQSARYYYERGDRPSPDVVQEFRSEATRLYSSINDALKQRLSGGRGSKQLKLPPPEPTKP